ncbi:unnamed protein product [Candidula unifasciata]|uniref:Uncharacterized protein n=1 Tax=Candidula unifasciata TaxID=100452 RepID=A0A8S3YD98_9EUPU|nr:unnamed protein product [Candidula unifasciata]
MATTADEDVRVQEIASKFAGKWKQVRGENIDDFFKEMGLNFLLRKLASQANPEATTTYENGKLTTKQEPVAGNDSKPTVSVREINEAGELVTTVYVGDVVCKRYFIKLPSS